MRNITDRLFNIAEINRVFGNLVYRNNYNHIYRFVSLITNYIVKEYNRYKVRNKVKNIYEIDTYYIPDGVYITRVIDASILKNIQSISFRRSSTPFTTVAINRYDHYQSFIESDVVMMDNSTVIPTVSGYTNPKVTISQNKVYIFNSSTFEYKQYHYFNGTLQLSKTVTYSVADTVVNSTDRYIALESPVFDSIEIRIGNNNPFKPFNSIGTSTNSSYRIIHNDTDYNKQYDYDKDGIISQSDLDYINNLNDNNILNNITDNGDLGNHDYFKKQTRYRLNAYRHDLTNKVLIDNVNSTNITITYRNDGLTPLNINDNEDYIYKYQYNENNYEYDKELVINDVFSVALMDGYITYLYKQDDTTVDIRIIDTIENVTDIMKINGEFYYIKDNKIYRPNDTLLKTSTEIKIDGSNTTVDGRFFQYIKGGYFVDLENDIVVTHIKLDDVIINNRTATPYKLNLFQPENIIDQLGIDIGIKRLDGQNNNDYLQVLKAYSKSSIGKRDPYKILGILNGNIVPDVAKISIVLHNYKSIVSAPSIFYRISSNGLFEHNRHNNNAITIRIVYNDTDDNQKIVIRSYGQIETNDNGFISNLSDSEKNTMLSSISSNNISPNDYEEYNTHNDIFNNSFTLKRDSIQDFSFYKITQDHYLINSIFKDDDVKRNISGVVTYPTGTFRGSSVSIYPIISNFNTEGATFNLVDDTDGLNVDSKTGEIKIEERAHGSGLNNHIDIIKRGNIGVIRVQIAIFIGSDRRIELFHPTSQIITTGSITYPSVNSSVTAITPSVSNYTHISDVNHTTPSSVTGISLNASSGVITISSDLANGTYPFIVNTYMKNRRGYLKSTLSIVKSAGSHIVSSAVNGVLTMDNRTTVASIGQESDGENQTMNRTIPNSNLYDLIYYNHNPLRIYNLNNIDIKDISDDVYLTISPYDNLKVNYGSSFSFNTSLLTSRPLHNVFFNTFENMSNYRIDLDGKILNSEIDYYSNDIVTTLPNGMFRYTFEISRFINKIIDSYRIQTTTNNFSISINGNIIDGITKTESGKRPSLTTAMVRTNSTYLFADSHSFNYVNVLKKTIDYMIGGGTYNPREYIIYDHTITSGTNKQTIPIIIPKYRKYTVKTAYKNTIDGNDILNLNIHDSDSIINI